MKRVKVVPFMSEIDRVEAATTRFKFPFNLGAERWEVSSLESYESVLQA